MTYRELTRRQLLTLFELWKPFKNLIFLVARAFFGKMPVSSSGYLAVLDRARCGYLGFHLSKKRLGRRKQTFSFKGNAMKTAVLSASYRRNVVYLKQPNNDDTRCRGLEKKLCFKVTLFWILLIYWLWQMLFFKKKTFFFNSLQLWYSSVPPYLFFAEKKKLAWGDNNRSSPGYIWCCTCRFRTKSSALESFDTYCIPSCLLGSVLLSFPLWRPADGYNFE